MLLPALEMCPIKSREYRVMMSVPVEVGHPIEPLE